tara:strand:+ start:816 stop:1217 length:402 start_codon:yes stop_codon:yes gene_type:complete
MKKIEHIGIAVKDLDESNKLFTKILGTNPYMIEDVESESVKTSFFNVGNTKIELVSATSQDSTIFKYLNKNKESIHHIAIDVEDIIKEMKRLKAEGIRLLNDEPRYGADNKMICFLHPKDTNGILIELCQEKD